MKERLYRISGRQTWLMATLLSICVTPLVQPGLAIPVLGGDAWLTGVFSLLGGLAGMNLAASLARRFPDRSFPELAASGLGPVLGGIYILLLALLCTVGAGANLHAFVAVAAGHDLPLMPTAYPALLIAAAATFAAYFGPEVVARSAEVLAPLILLGLLLIDVLGFSNAAPGRLLPLELPWTALGSSVALASFGTARGFLFVLLFGSFAKTLPSTAALQWGTAMAAAQIGLACALPVAVYGAPFAAKDRFPFVSSIGTTGWQWIPTHATVLLLITWHAIAFVVFAAYAWLGAWLLKRLIPRASWLWLTIGSGGIGGLIASWVLSAQGVALLFSYWNDAVIALGVGVPAILWLRLQRRPQPAGWVLEP